MKTLSREAQSIIDAVRALEEPPPGAEQAVRAALDARLVAAAAAAGGGAALHGTVATAGGVATKGAAMGALGTSLATKIVVGALITAGLGTAGTIAVRHAAVVPAPAMAHAHRALSLRPAPAVVADAPPEPEPAPEREGPRAIATLPRPAAVAQSAAAHPAAPAAKPSCGMAQELKLVQDSERDLQEHRPSQVLSALDHATATCSGGALEQERLALRILALCQLGKTEEAHAAITRLEHDAPQSPSLDRIHSECR